MSDDLLTEQTIQSHSGIMEIDFESSFYNEYIEEASFLYGQQLQLFDDPDVSWKDRDEFIDRRIQTFVDALVRGSSLAVDVCSEKASRGDFGELHVALRVFCRQDRVDLIEDVLETVDLADTEKVQAVSDALSYDLPRHLQEQVLPPLFERGPEHALIAARVCAFQRLDYERDCCKAIETYSPEKTTVRALLHGLGRIKLSVSAVVTLIPLLSHEDREVVKATIYTLIRVEELRQVNPVPRSSWPVMALALSRGKDSYEDILTHPDPEKDKALALGLLGDIRAVPELIARLSDPETAENAALGLSLITGAALFEDHFIPEEIDPDTLFADEREKYDKGELYAPGDEPGQIINRISQNPETWQAWWDEHQMMYNPGRRYRNGIPFSPESLILTLRSENSPEALRVLAYEELVIRYGIDAPFETDMRVKDQHDAISDLEKQIFHVDPGLWHYKGDPV